MLHKCQSITQQSYNMFLSSQTFHWMIRIPNGYSTLWETSKEIHRRMRGNTLLSISISRKLDNTCWPALPGHPLTTRGVKKFTKLIIIITNTPIFQGPKNHTIQAFPLSLPLCCTFIPLMIIISLKKMEKIK